MKFLLLSNIIGIVALIVWTFSIQVNKKTNIMKLQLLANIFYAIQYFLIGANSAACMNLVSTGRYYIYTKNEEKGKTNSYFLLVSFIVMILLIGLCTYDGALSLIPIMITICYTYATWQKNTKVLRFIFLFAAIVWIFYNFYVGAYVTIVGNMMEIVSGSIAIFRFDIDNRKKEKQESENNEQ